MRRSFTASIAAALVLSLAMVVAPTALAASNNASRGKGNKPDTFEPGPDVHAKLVKSGKVANAQANEPARPGQIRTWLAYDNAFGEYYTRNYKFKAKGKHVEVWTAEGTRTRHDVTQTDLNFPDGDCRNGARTDVTQAQINYLVDQFDKNMYPIESAAFSVPPGRNGIKAPLAEILGLPNGYYAGEKDDIVVLIDNVRDDNFYDTNNTNGFSYVAGFFSSAFNFYFDRNVMSIDAFDWLHRTGANPPNEPVPGDLCASAPARPFLYESTFAHEYQHLLRSYSDPAETTWMNEGTSDVAMVLTGYANPATPITDVGFDSHIQCFQGFNGVQTAANPNPRPGGPENSLNLWDDQGLDHEQEILCDYGAAFSYMLWLGDTYGEEIYTRTHNDDVNQGFEAVQAVLDDEAPGTTVDQTIDAWLATMALDQVIDDGGTLTGADPNLIQVDTLNGHINWDTSDAYDTPGVPPNGGDFVRVRDDSGTYLSAADVDSIEFQGAQQLPEKPIDWTVDTEFGNPAGSLHAPVADNVNSVIVRDVNVPAGSPELTFDAAWDLEDTFDFGYAQITTDGGESYTSLTCTDTVDDTDPNLGNVGPGFGQGFNLFNDPPVFSPEACDLTPYAGQTVGLAFRLYTDGGVHGNGFWVDNVAIDGTAISDGSTLDGWQSQTQYNPIDVEGYTVQLLSYDSDHTQAHLFSLPLDSSFHGSISGTDLANAIGATADVVSVIVTYHDDTELVDQYAPYTLTVNGVTQPGGSA